jgi:hypothetical protein
LGAYRLLIEAGGEADLLKLFVEPTMLRGGVGMQLFHWATDLDLGDADNLAVLFRHRN